MSHPSSPATPEPASGWTRYATEPAGIVIMLLDGAMVAVSDAIQHSQAGRHAERREAVDKAVRIIESGLRPALVVSDGAEGRLSLDTLYEYISTRLALAGDKDQVRILEEVYGLLRGLRNAWKSAG
ncbi:flagellar protein FliS [Oxalobacteraceae bacterium OM1]|nr:flagellar protein FliS [Oxalobacteraceae bacterium OM1]